jgi:crotonobetainyl-CoA:carnitine CoA-transferase CaiB-like acyl-CoA transferase
MTTTGPNPGRPAYLKNLRVLELGDGISGSAASSVLQSMGASIDKVRAPTSPAHGGVPTTTVRGTPDSVLSCLLDVGKSFVLAPSLDRMSDYDVVISDRMGVLGSILPTDADAYREVLQQTQTGAWVTISAFGLVGSRRDWRGNDLIVGAAGALVAIDAKTGAPIKLGGHQAVLGAGHVSALAACHAIDRRRSTGRFVHADVSAHDAAVVTGPVLRLAHAMFRCAGASGSRRNGAPAGFYDCVDGLVRISAMEEHQFQALCRALGNPAWAAEFSSAATRIDRAEELDQLVSAHIASWPKAECEARLQKEGVPATAMYSATDILQWPQFQARQAFDPVCVGDRDAVVVGSPFRSVGAPQTDRRAEDAHDSKSGGLNGLQVIEVGHVLAVPLAASLLGALGANVIKLEDPRRIDVYRRRGPYIDGDSGAPGPDGGPGLERSAYFAVMNHSKRSVSVDLEGDPLALREILARGDVLIENLGPRRARRLRVDAATASTDHPHLQAVSSSGWGHVGPWSSYKVYAYNLHAACGLCSQTVTAEGNPAEIDLAWGDLVTAYAVATVIAARAIGDRGQARDAAVDLSMAELLAARFNDKIAAASCDLDDAGPEDGTSHQAPFAPNSFYQTGDGRWVAISVSTDEEWHLLCSALELPEAAAGLGADRASRVDRQTEIDSELAKSVFQHQSHELVARLQSKGLMSAVAATIPELLVDGHLAERGLFPTVSHLVWGSGQLVGLPWQLLGDGPVMLTAPPIFGSTSLGEVTARQGVES